MLRELFRALFLAGTPVAVASYLLIWWALKNKYLQGASNLKDVEVHFKGVSKARSRKKKDEKKLRKKGGGAVVMKTGQQEEHKMNPVHNKWLSFGGGFYGVVGLLTYVVLAGATLIAYGASPRATLALAMAGKAMAFLSGRGSVYGEDVKEVALDVLRHRVLVTYEAEAREVTSDRIAQQILDHVRVP